MNAVFIPKEHPDIPDFYKIKISFLTGKTDEFNVASHSFINDRLTMLEILTHEDGVLLVPMSGVAKIEFDRNYSKLVELRKQKEKGAQ